MVRKGNPTRAPAEVSLGALSPAAGLVDAAVRGHAKSILHTVAHIVVVPESTVSARVAVLGLQKRLSRGRRRRVIENVAKLGYI